MTKNDDDEFNDVVKGLPSDNTAQKSSVKFVLSFLVSGIIVIILIIMFGDNVRYMFSEDNYIQQQALMNGAVSLLIGSLQAWIFKAKIKSRVYIFIFFSLLGGVIGGILGGALINTGVRTSIIVGAVNGALSGGISSLAQNRLMGNKKYGARWFFYNTVSWAIIYALAWAFAWKPESSSFILALAGGFIVVASGISLVAFLRKTPQIEFS